MVSLGGLARKIFGSSNDRRVKSMRPACRSDQRPGTEIAALSDAELRARTDEFRERARQRRDARRPAACRPSPWCARRPSARSAMRHFDVQLVGGMVLHQGDIAEMQHRRRQDAGRHRCRSTSTRWPARACTSSPSTTTWPSRDAEWMGRIYKFLGLTVGVIVHGLTTRSAAPPMPATSPTAPTTSSASTICATT